MPIASVSAPRAASVTVSSEMESQLMPFTSSAKPWPSPVRHSDSSDSGLSHPAVSPPKSTHSPKGTSGASTPVLAAVSQMSAASPHAARTASMPSPALRAAAIAPATLHFALKLTPSWTDSTKSSQTAAFSSSVRSPTVSPSSASTAMSTTPASCSVIPAASLTSSQPSASAHAVSSIKRSNDIGFPR